MFDERFALLDLEYTARDAGSMARKWKGEHREIIQIGLVIVEVPELTPLSVDRIYVRTIIEPVLSDHIKNLTGISQEDIDAKGIPLLPALSYVERKTRYMPIWSYGRDRDVLVENCDLQEMYCPIDPGRCCDLKPVLAPILESVGVDPRAYSSGELYRAFGLEGFPPHQGDNDMLNLLAVLRELRVRGRI